MKKKAFVITAIISVVCIIGGNTAFASVADTSESISLSVSNKVNASSKPTEGKQSIDPNKGTGSINTSEIKSIRTESINGTSSSISVSESQSSLSENYLSAGSCYIEKTSTGQIKGYADTTATTIVDELGFTLTFQVWNDATGWTNIESVKNSLFNNTYVYGTYLRNYSSGKYYRVSVTHYVKKNGIMNTATSVSDYIYN